MATSAKRLKQIIRKQDIKTYKQLVLYVYGNCGERLRAAVIEDEHDLRRYLDARFVARERVPVYHHPSTNKPPRLKLTR